MSKKLERRLYSVMSKARRIRKIAEQQKTDAQQTAVVAQQDKSIDNAASAQLQAILSEVERLNTMFTTQPIAKALAYLNDRVQYLKLTAGRK